jgi:hypothetical protein
MVSGTAPKKRSPRARAVLLTFDSSGEAVALHIPVQNARGSILEFVTESFGLVSTQAGRLSWLKDAQKVADEYDLPLVVIDTSKSYAASQGFPPHITRGFVYCTKKREWKPDLFGRSKLTTAQYAAKHLSAPPLMTKLAEAVCIGAWAECAAPVREILRKTKNGTIHLHRSQKAA